MSTQAQGQEVKFLKRKTGPHAGQVFPVPAAPPQTQAQAPTAAETEEKLGSGRKSKFRVKLDNLNVNCNIRWETEHVGRLVEVKMFAPNGLEVFKKYENDSPSRSVYRDSAGNEVAPADVKLAQVFPDGTKRPLSGKFEMTKEIVGKPLPKDKMNDFLPDSYCEIWGETPADNAELKQLAFKLIQNGQCIGVDQFIKAAGTKVYVGFITPVISQDGTKFGLEMMVSENLKTKRRWMSVEDEDSTPAQISTGRDAPVVPNLFGTAPAPAPQAAPIHIETKSVRADDSLGNDRVLCGVCGRMHSRKSAIARAHGVV
jgi:hypothetical protein